MASGHSSVTTGLTAASSSGDRALRLRRIDDDEGDRPPWPAEVGIIVGDPRFLFRPITLRHRTIINRKIDWTPPALLSQKRKEYFCCISVFRTLVGIGEN